MTESVLTIDGSELARVSMDGVAIIEAGEIVHANDAFIEIHGANSRDIMIGREWADLYTIEGSERGADELLERVRSEGDWRGLANGRRLDGEDVAVELSMCATDDCLVSVVSDVPGPDSTEQTPPATEAQSARPTLEAGQEGLPWDVLDALDDVVYIVDEEDSVVEWNRRLNERLGYTDEELVEMSLPEFLAPEDRNHLASADRRMVDLPDRVRELEVVTKDGVRIPHELRGVTFTDGVSGDRYRVGIARDITERREREDRLERYETIVETVDDGVYVLDEDLHVDMANERFYEMMAQFGFSRDDVQSLHAHDLVVKEDERAELEASIERAIESEPHIGSFEMSTEKADSELAVFESRFRLYPEPEGEHRGCIGILRDITERKERERELREARRFNAELVENAPFSMVRVDEDFRITYVNPRTEEVTGLPDDAESEALGVDIRELPSVAATGEAHRFTPLKDGETIEFEFPFESLYGREVYFTGRGVPLMENGEFAGAVLMAVDISDRRRQEKALERQRDELDTLNEINELLLAVARDLFESPTQVDVERTVCEQLADSDLYQFAWIGKPGRGGTQLSPDAFAGIDEDVVGSFAVDVSESEAGVESIGQAFRTRTVQVSQDLQIESACEWWRESSIEPDVRSVAAVPLVYKGRAYGVLAVYSSRPLAFSQREQRGFQMLGEATGYAINASRTRELLFAEQVSEVEIRLEVQGEFLLDLSGQLDCSLSLEGYVSIGEGLWLMYFALPRSVSEQFADMARDASTIEAVRSVGNGAETLVGLTSNSSLFDEIASLGGRITSGVIESGQVTVVMEVPQTTAVSEFVEQFKSTYPDADLLAIRDGERPTERSGWLADTGPVDLTERQEQALEAAYLAGYFEWPRENSAKDVADLLDISRPTLQAHLRKAEAELVGLFLDGTGEEGKAPDSGSL